VIVQPPEGALDQPDQFIGSAVDGLVQGRGLVSHRNRLAILQAGFHQATHVVIAALFVTIFITQMNFHPRDVIADSTQGTFHNTTDLSGQRLVTFDITVGIDLDLHGVLLGR
jgi:hypothetical protein